MRSYENIALDPHELAPGIDTTQAGWLAAPLSKLFEQQLVSFPHLHDITEQVRNLPAHGTTVNGSGAKIILNRGRGNRLQPPWIASPDGSNPCCLDASNVSPDQRGIILENAGVFIGPNPFPITSAQHTTGIGLDHSPQTLETILRPSLEVARSLGGGHTVIANGDGGGATVPEHYHLQSFQGALPIHTDLARKEDEGGRPRQFYLAEGLGRTVLVATGTDKEAIASTIETAYDQLQSESGPDAPLSFNLIVKHDRATYQVLFFPRRTAFPSVYRQHGVDKGPASFESGGYLVTSSVGLFDAWRSDPTTIQHMYDELYLPQDDVSDALGKMVLRAA